MCSSDLCQHHDQPKENLGDALNRLEHAFADSSFKEAALRAAVEVQTEAEEHYRAYVRIFDPQGKVLVESPGMEDVFAGHEFPSAPPAAIALASPVSLMHANGRSFLLLTGRL